MNHQTLWAMALAALLASEVSAQQFVYPAKGQTPATQKADEAACHSWAVQQTGFDPTKPPPATAAAAPPTTATGTQPGAGIRGAAKVATAATGSSATAAGVLCQGTHRMPGGQGLHRQVTAEHWPGATRDWTPTGPVTLNPERDSVVAAHSMAEAEDRQPLAA